MYLKELKIKLNQYGDRVGKYSGVATFDNTQGSVALNLTPEMCEDIFKTCAAGIIATAKEAAENLTCAVIEHQKSLESDI